MSDPILIVDDFAIGLDRFDQRSLIDQGDVDTGLFHGLGRGKLNTPFPRPAMAVVLDARSGGQRRIGPFEILGGHGVRRGDLSDIGMLEGTIVDAMLFAPAVVLFGGQQRGIAFDAIGLGHVVLAAPLCSLGVL